MRCPSPPSTHPLSHMIPSRSSLVNVFPPSTLAFCVYSLPPKLKIVNNRSVSKFLHCSDFLGWVFDKEMNILFCAVKTKEGV